MTFRIGPLRKKYISWKICHWSHWVPIAFSKTSIMDIFFTFKKDKLPVKKRLLWARHHLSVLRVRRGHSTYLLDVLESICQARATKFKMWLSYWLKERNGLKMLLAEAFISAHGQNTITKLKGFVKLLIPCRLLSDLVFVTKLLKLKKVECNCNPSETCPFVETTF